MVDYKNILKEITRDIDEPVKVGDTGLFKKGKYRVFIIYEDLSYRDFKVKLKESYIFTIKKKSYLVVPECILRGSNPILIYYFNNPYPVGFKYESVKDYKKVHSAPVVDASNLRSVLTSNLINKMYGSTMSIKNILIIVIVAFIIVLVILQLTGTVDVVGLLTGYEKS